MAAAGAKGLVGGQRAGAAGHHRHARWCRARNWVMAKLAELAGSFDALVVFFGDLDSFKSVTDRLGHAAGDEVLATGARRLADRVAYAVDRFDRTSGHISFPGASVGMAFGGSRRLGAD